MNEDSNGDFKIADMALKGYYRFPKTSSNRDVSTIWIIGVNLYNYI